MSRQTVRVRKSALAAAAALALGAPMQPSTAASCTWNPASGNWAVAANWSCAVVPRGPNGDTAGIAAGKVVTIDDIESPGVFRSIFILNNAGTVQLDAFGLTLTGGGSTSINTGTINVGGVSTAALQVGPGHNITNTGGVINVGAGSVINHFGSAIIGGAINGAGRIAPVANGSNFLSGVTLGANLDMLSAQGAARIVNGMTINGRVDIGANSVFAPQGDQTIGGSGQIVFADNNGSNRFNVEAGNLILGPNLTVRGGNGVIGQQAFVGGGATLTNQGLISADVAGSSITIAINGTLFNTGTMRAQNGGLLQLNPMAGVDNSGGTLLADNNAIVQFNGVAVTGGTLNSIGSGTLRANAVSSNFLNGVTLNGVLDLATAQGVERVSAGGMVLNGRINIGANSVFAPQGDQTISGSGQIVFADNNGSNRLNVEAGNLVLGSGITVRGENGLIGQQAFLGGGATLTNNGTIQSDVAGRSITIAVNGLTTNNGTLAALNGGTLNLNSAIDNGAGSQILVGAGSVVRQNGITISGNTTITGPGSFQPNASLANILSGATLSGTIDMTSGQGVERVTGGLSLNNASILIGANSILAPQGGQTIGGTGSIVFTDNNGSNRLNVEAGNLVLGSGITVRGENGVIGQQNFLGGGATLTNNGTIQSDVAGRSITLQVNGLTTNNNVMAALNGGTLNLNSPVHGNTGSQILAGAGSLVAQNGVTLSGDMTITGTGTFRPNASSFNFLSGVTLSGNVDMLSASGVERVTGGLTLNNANIQIGANSIFAPQGDQTIGGSGTFTFADNNGGNRFNVEAGNLTLAPGVTIHGGNGNIGLQSFVGGGATLTNQGLINADANGLTIGLTVNGLTINQGVMKAQDGGTLRLDTAVDNSAGTLRADSGGLVYFNGMTVTGGALNTSGGLFRSSASNNNFLNGVTLNGTLDMASLFAVERISAGGMILNGTINIGANSVFAPQGDQTISGTGAIVFADNNGANRFNVEAGNLTIGAGVTVRGQNGVIGNQLFVGGVANLINNGTINADAGGTITINVNGALTNNGLLRAQSGTLAIQDNLSGTGSLQVDATGAMTLANGGNAQGRLLMGAAGSAIHIGNGNLVISNDYTNDAAGTGNAFNRRAGVSGAGQVRAGGDVAQVITGAQIINGNTNNATLTIGNVRVGNNSFNYQIGNAGTTGPTLRGAIQTNVNGGSLNDARLSGVGVTASNYNADAPGGSSGNLAVNFNAANPGALAPLAGQVLNLRSNFENIGDQKLNIVLAAGAGAYVPATGDTTPTTINLPNQRIGGAASTNLVVANNAVGPAGFVEDLKALPSLITGQAQASGQITDRLAGTNNTGNGAITVSVNTAAEGARSGQVTLQYRSQGTVGGVDKGLGGEIDANSQVVTVNGNVYKPAAGSLLTPNHTYTVQVGQTVPFTLGIQNSASGAANFVEDLNARFGSFNGNANPLIQVTTLGQVSGLAAGQSNNSSMSVSVKGNAPGVVNNFAVPIDFFTAGTVGGTPIAGLAEAAVGSTNFLVNANISLNAINPALPAINGTAHPGGVALNFGNVRINSSAQQALNVANLSGQAPQAALNASFVGGPSGDATHNGGSVALLLPGNNNNAAMAVGLNTAAAGARSGSVTVNHVSDANNVGNCAPNCLFDLGNQVVSVQGNVYRLANPVIGTPVVNIAARVGDAVGATRGVQIQNNSPDIFTEGLKVGISSSGGNAQGAGSIANLAAQGSDNTNIKVGLVSTAVAGNTVGNVNLSFVSTGAGTTNAPDVPAQVAAGSVTVQGKVYTPAQGAVTNPAAGGNGVHTVDFGIVRVGDSPSRQVTVSNGAAVTALNDTLRADLSPIGGPFTQSGPITALQAAQSGQFDIGLSPAALAGVYSRDATASFLSQNPDMADIPGGADATVRVLATVNAYANPLFGKVGGAGNFGCAGLVCTLDLGDVDVNAPDLFSELFLRNAVAGPADALDGSFGLALGAFGGSGFDPVDDLLPGATRMGLNLSFDPQALGLYTGQFTFDGASANADNPDSPLARITVRLRANVVDGNPPPPGVPLPGTLLLVLGAVLAGLGSQVTRKGARRAYH